MKSTIPDIVSARLKAIGCDPIPAPIRSKIEADFERAIVELAGKTITLGSFARAVKGVFGRRKLLTTIPPLPSGTVGEA